MLARAVRKRKSKAQAVIGFVLAVRALMGCECALWRRMQYKTQSTLGTVMVFMVISVTPNKDIKLSHSVSLLPLHYYLLSAIDLSSLRAQHSTAAHRCAAHNCCCAEEKKARAQAFSASSAPSACHFGK
jgi:hypothetical protein